MAGENIQKENQIQNQEKIKNEEAVIEISFKSGSWSRTIEYSRLYSIRKKKFIKGRLITGNLDWIIKYRILPGVYLLWHIEGFKDDRGVDLTIKKIRIDNERKMEELETLISINLTWDEFLSIESDEKAPALLREFIRKRPSYHDTGEIPDVEGDVEEVIEYLKSKERELAEY